MAAAGRAACAQTALSRVKAPRWRAASATGAVPVNGSAASSRSHTHRSASALPWKPASCRRAGGCRLSRPQTWAVAAASDGQTSVGRPSLAAGQRSLSRLDWPVKGDSDMPQPGEARGSASHGVPREQRFLSRRSRRRQLSGTSKRCLHRGAQAPRSRPPAATMNGHLAYASDEYFSSGSASPAGMDLAGQDVVWEAVLEEALCQSESEPYLASFLYATILAHPTLERAIAFHLANKLADATLLSTQLFTLFADIFEEVAVIQDAIRADMIAFKERDPACEGYVHGMLYYKGFLACQVHRASHHLWQQGRLGLALALQNRVSEAFQVDLHPGAVMGKGLMFDHATGVVVGETAVIGDNVSILHHVTLGGTGHFAGDRHPKIGNGVLIGAGATLLGPIKIGDGAQVSACSLVLSDVPPHTMAVGVPAKIIRKLEPPTEGKERPGCTMDHTSGIIDYVI
eukprot:SM000134S26945  [mRNA]  locus=s134:277523:279611:+ [translate_table: standard]